MAKIAIVTDSDSALPPQLAAQYAIEVVPIPVYFGQEILDTGIEINDAQLFARVDKSGKLPTTSAPTPARFAQAFMSAFHSGAKAVVCICVSSSVSATYQAALKAKEMLPGQDIVVVDSRSMCMTQGFMVLAAAEAAQAGANKVEVVERATEINGRTNLYAALATLKYLAMSGRVGYLAAGVAHLLDVKPILAVRNGKLELVERIRSRQRAWSRTLELMAESVNNRPIERMAIFHANALGMARDFEALAQTMLPCPPNIIITDVTPGLSVHTGPDMVGITAVVKP